jgi:methylthioribose-1-phosphate isomerase
VTDHIRFDGRTLWLLDQTRLPNEQVVIPCATSEAVAQAIRVLAVRGAPAIGVAAAYGLAVAHAGGEDLAVARQTLLGSRPTAVNLRWAVERLWALPPAQWARAAADLHAADVAANRALGDHGAALLRGARNVYHHCNTGTLATAGWGTALGIVRSTVAAGTPLHVWVGETRPLLQGARLTAWELAQDGVPCTLVCDGAAASLFAAGQVDAVLVGCDRVAANGDAANKIGTLNLAVIAARYGVPLYVAMPTSTLDRACPTGRDIPIEARDPAEVYGYGSTRWAADVPAYNPAFDVTPADLVTAWVTERGVWRPPFPPLDPGPPVG